jgi:ABC-2 type transport system ATP-binding protein
MDFSFQVSKLNKSYAGIPVIRDFSFQGKKGEIIGCIGPNGSGKTTLIRILCGLVKPDSGTGESLGYNLLTEGEKIQKKVGYMPQSFSLYKYLTMYENLVFIARLYSVKKAKQRVEFLSELLQLTPKMQVLAAKLSIGWKQRLSLAAALIPNPEILFLDEPTAGVDPNIRLRFWQIIEETADRGTTIFVSTHYMSELERCQKVIYLDNGRTLAKGYVKDILNSTTISVWVVSGKALHTLANKLRPLPGIDNIIEYGATLRVIGNNPLLLFNSLRPYLLHLDYQWRAVAPVLEDIFLSTLKDDNHA